VGTTPTNAQRRLALLLLLPYHGVLNARSALIDFFSHVGRDMAVIGRNQKGEFLATDESTVGFKMTMSKKIACYF
jgi:hypothetical protein